MSRRGRAGFVQFAVCDRCCTPIVIMRMRCSGAIVRCEARLLHLDVGLRLVTEDGCMVYGRGRHDRILGREVHATHCRRVPHVPLARVLAAVLEWERKHVSN